MRVEKRGGILLGVLVFLLPLVSAGVMTFNPTDTALDGYVASVIQNSCFDEPTGCPSGETCNPDSVSGESFVSDSSIIAFGAQPVEQPVGTTTSMQWLRGFIQFDLSALPQNAIITHVVLNIYPFDANYATMSIKKLPDISSQLDISLYATIGSAPTTYVTVASGDLTMDTMNPINLGSQAVTDLQGNIQAGTMYFSLGFQTDEESCNDGSFLTANHVWIKSSDAITEIPELIVSYISDDDIQPVRDCPGIRICSIDYYCGVGDGFCPETYARQKPGFEDFSCTSDLNTQCCDLDCGVVDGYDCGGPPSIPGVKGYLVPVRFTPGYAFYLKRPTNYNPLFWFEQNLYDNILIENSCLGQLQDGQNCNQSWIVAASVDAGLTNYPFFGMYNSTTSTQPSQGPLYSESNVKTPVVDVVVYS